MLEKVLEVFLEYVLTISDWVGYPFEYFSGTSYRSSETSRNNIPGAISESLRKHNLWRKLFIVR